MGICLAKLGVYWFGWRLGNFANRIGVPIRTCLKWQRWLENWITKNNAAQVRQQLAYNQTLHYRSLVKFSDTYYCIRHGLIKLLQESKGSGIRFTRRARLGQSTSTGSTATSDWLRLNHRGTRVYPIESSKASSNCKFNSSVWLLKKVVPW